jgi:hypothetical protein
MSFSTYCKHAGLSGVQTLVGWVGGGGAGWDFLDQVSFLRVKWMGCSVDHPPLSVLGLSIGTAIPLLPLSACLAWYWTAFTILFWVIPQFSCLSKVILMPFSVSFFHPLLLHGQTVTVASLLTSLTTSKFQILL